MSQQTMLGIIVAVIAVFVIFLIRSRSEERQQQGRGVPAPGPAPQIGGGTKISFSVSSKPGVTSSVHMSTKLVEQHLQGEDKQVLERWLGVTGPEWTQAQKARFAAAFERFIWDGEGLSIFLKGFSKILHTQFPTVQGTPLDIEIPPDVRAIIAKLTGSATSAGQ